MKRIFPKKELRPGFMENLKDVINIQVETDKDSLKSLLADNKVIVSITRGPKIITKLVKVSASRKVAPRPTIARAAVENIKTVRKLCKDNGDASYIFVLVEKLKDNIKNLNLQDMTPEAADLFNKEIKDLIASLSTTQKLLLPILK